METVAGGGEETRPNASSSETESAKQNDAVGSGEKTLEDNGVRVSENGEHKVVVDESGGVEDCVMMNGVSSLLKLKQDVSDEEEEEEEDDEEDEEEHGYHVGDFVWGKIKNHPWWPGQIYDPSEASDLALKIKQKGKLLVAYFGDGTFAWCGPSQLKPFAESFKECSKVSSSRGIVTAVEEAVGEMGRHMERLLMRDCADVNRVVKNAGIKEGVAVRDVRREMISALLVGKPEGILQDVRGFAETVSFSGLLELEIVKRKVSAFYRSKRGYGLTEFPEPQSVPGLEDKNNEDDDDDDDEEEEEDFDDGGGAKPSTIEKGKEEEALVPEESSIQRSLEKCSGFPDHRLQHRRKQKSIAEILENESCAKVRFEIEPEDGKGKSSRKKVKRLDEVNGELALVTTTNPRGRRMKEVAGNEEDSKGKRKRKKRDEDGSGEREEAETDNDSTPLAALRKKVKVDDASSAGNGETSTTQTTKRERKKSKYFSPEFLSDFPTKGRKKTKTEPESSIVPSQSQVGEELMANASDSLVVAEEEDNPCELLLLENAVGHQELSEELSNAVDFLRLGATTEEIRDLIRVSALGTEYPKDSSSRDMVREFMSIYRSFTYREGVNSRFLGSSNTTNADKEDMNGTGKTEEIEKTGKEENETTKKQRKQKTPASKKQADKVEESHKEVTETAKKERKRKKTESEKKAHEEEETLKESMKKERKAKKPKSRKQGDEEKEASGSTKKEKKSKKPKFEEQERPNESEKKEREVKTKKQESEKEFSGAELFVTFGPGSTLPTKEALVEIYGKFGALDEERSCVLDSNFCACVAFLNVDDGEKAFESSLENSPFPLTSTIKFRLKYPNERAGEKRGEAEAAETKPVEMGHLKKKFEEMISWVDKSEGGLTEEVKVKLEEEMVNLLEEVRKMPLS